MKDRFTKGSYVDYPCSCGRKMRLQEDIAQMKKDSMAKLECPDCNLEKEYTVRELRSIINAKYSA